jgi:cellulose synthase/poly-beta-1,6-N-acetylglucosamine synthase-like glycosyltransferase
MLLPRILFIVFSFIFWWCFQGYFLYLYFFVGKKNNRRFDAVDLMAGKKFAVVVLSYNEKEYIARKIDNLATLDYSQFSVYFVDASDDGTADIITAKIKGLSGFHLIRAKTRGRSFQINDALSVINDDYILVTDVDAQLQSDALKVIAAEFDDKTVGVVGGYVKPVTSYGLDMVFWRSHNSVKFFETIHGYSPIVSGACYAFRREVVERIPADVWSDDVYIPLLAHLRGFGCVYSSFIAVEELRAPQSFKTFIFSKIRKSQDIIKEFLRFLPFIPRMDTVWAIIYLTKLFQVVFSPLLAILMFLLLPYQGLYIVSAVVFVFASAILLQRFLLKKVMPDKGNILEVFVVFIMSEAIILLALLRYFWDKCKKI